MIKAPEAPQEALFPDLTPLLDIIFIILIFLLLTAQAPLLELPLTLPTVVEKLAPAQAQQTRLKLSLSASGSWYFNREEVGSLESLRARLLQEFETQNHPSIDIAADKNAPLGDFLSLLSFLREQKASDTRIIMDQPHGIQTR